MSAAVNVASAPTGLLIPPSNSLIIYSLVSGGTSVTALFMAGYIPGILWGNSYYGCCILYSEEKGYKTVTKEKITLSQALKVILRCNTKFIVNSNNNRWYNRWYIYSYRRCGNSSCILLLLSMLLYKSIKIKDLPRILLRSSEYDSYDSILNRGIIYNVLGISIY